MSNKTNIKLLETILPQCRLAVLKYELTVFALLFILNFSCAQTPNLTGTWKGSLSQDDKAWAFDMTLTLSQKENIINGTSKIVSNDGSGAYAIHTVEGEMKGNNIQLIDVAIAEEGNSGYFSWCKKIYQGKVLFKKDSILFSGSWQNDGRKIFHNKQLTYSASYCYPGTFIVLKEIDTAFIHRRIEIKNEINVVSDTIKLAFYDNGEIDNDTISVYYNNILLIDHKKLSYIPIEITVAIQPNTENKIVMFANNEGSTPPNTALLVFFDNGLRREITIDSSTKRSEAIIFKKAQ